MPSVRYYNQTAPFWDFVANMEEQGGSHPFFGGNNDNQQQQSGHPWEGAFFPFGGPFAHRPRHHPYHRGPPHHGPEHPPPPHAETDESDKEKAPQADPEEGPSTRGPRCQPSGRGRCGGRGRGGFRGRHGPFGAWADAFFNNTTTSENKGDETFTPEVDVFDTNEAFILHISLPGAKKEDVGVSWDAEKSELSIGGVVYRPGDEEFLKSLALDERKVGVFERKVRLGSRANPASVDVEGIVARMEDGVLRVEVPKMDAGFVEVRKVDVE